MHAARNITLCNKDCLCLFVCPTGATNTETGQIDFDRCLNGCRLCVDACPSHAIYLVQDAYPEPEPKDPNLAKAMLSLMERKYEQERMAETIASYSDNSSAVKLAKALQHSCRIVAEDCAREADYMLPQSPAVRKLLTNLQKSSEPGIQEIIQQLLKLE